jgi:hypothetical protein
MLAAAYCSLDDRERAFELLAKSVVERDVWAFWLYVDRNSTACATTHASTICCAE